MNALIRKISAVLLLSWIPLHAANVDALYVSAAQVPVTVGGYTATGNSVTLGLKFAPPTGTTLTVVNNTGLAFIQGTFDNLAHGQRVSIPYGGIGYEFVANYYGGSGNDLVLVWANNRAFAWGANSYGQLGDNTATRRYMPGPVTATGVLAGKTVVAIAVGAQHSLALCADGTVAAWGKNDYGQLGDNTTTNRSEPVAVNTVSGVSALAGKTVVAVAAGARHSLALCSDGTVATWGNNSDAQLGSYSFTSRYVPGAVNTASGISALAGKTVVAVAAGDFHSLALCSDGTVTAWGENIHGGLGDNSSTTRTAPVAVNTAAGISALAGRVVVALAGGEFHSLALCADGTVAAWGDNSSGQLGDNTTTNRFVPVAVSKVAGYSALFGKTVVGVAAGGRHSLAVCADGTAAAWGHNSSDQIGDNSGTNCLLPVAVNNTSGGSALVGKTVVAVAAGYAHSLALCTDGTAAGWGLNWYGQLGDNTDTSRSVPVTASNSLLAYRERFTMIRSGSNADHSLAVVAVPNIPDFHLMGNGWPIFKGSTTPNAANHTDFGSGNVGGGAVTRTFTIRNTGTLPLNLTGAPKVTVGGAHAADFTVTRQPTSSIAPGGSETFEISFTPGATWLRSATVGIASDDPDESPFGFAIQGTGAGTITATYSAAGEVPLTTGAITATGSTVHLALNHLPSTGTELVVVRNTGLGFIQGAFDNLAHGQRLSLPYGGISYEFVANYYGGSGNDLVLSWANQQVFGWGGDTGLTRSMPAPMPDPGVLAGKTVVAVATGENHSLALCADGAVAAWGSNASGQLGDNSNTTRSAPVLVNTASGVSALAGKTVVAVAAGASLSLALCTDGTVAAWGENQDGQLGNGGSPDRSVPVMVNRTAGLSALSGKTVVAVAAGDSHSLALCSDGTVAAWGRNEAGQLGDTTPLDRTEPVAVNMAAGVSALAGKTVVALAAGEFHSLALCSDGTIAAWGNNYSGQLGDNTTTPRATPVAVNTASGSSALAGKTVVAVAAGTSHSLALCADGTVAAWGNNVYGQLGDTTTTYRALPVAVNTASGGSALAGKTVSRVAAGAYHCLARCSDGTIAAWGSDSVGQLGDNTMINRATPVEVKIPLAGGGRFTRVQSGSMANHSLALAAVPYDPDIHLTGNGVTIARGNTTPSATNHTDFGSAPVGGGAVVRTFTMRNTGTLPLNLTGEPRVAVTGTQAADFTVTRQPASPIPPGGSETFEVSFTPGAAWLRTATLGIASDDLDENPYDFAIQGTGAGALAAIYSTGGEVPLDVGAFTASGSSVSFALNHAPATGADLMVVRNTGLVFIQGAFDNLAQGQKVSLPYDGIDYEYVANYYGGSGNDLVLVWANNRVFAWGDNTAGQLGDNSVMNRRIPVPMPTTGVLAGKTVVAVAAGESHSLALCSDGTIAAWGFNSSGQLGDGTTVSRSVPVAVSRAAGVSVLFGKTVVAVAAGISHSLALCSDGTVAVWGYNYNGLGDGSNSRNVPVAVSMTAGKSALAGKTVVAVAAGSSHSLALCSDGTIAAWGDNYYGKLGDGTTVNRPYPVAVNAAAGLSALAGKSVAAIAAGESHSLALCTDGTVAAWGYNSSGILGDGTTISRLVPVTVSRAAGISALAGQTVAAVAAGKYHSLALCADGTVAAWGDNYRGRLGDGTSTTRSAPVLVNTASGVSALAGKTVAAVAAGSSHSLALCQDGTAVAWGANAAGQLGDDSAVDRPVPAEVNDSPLAFRERFTLVRAGPGASHTLALAAIPYTADLQLTGNSVPISNGSATPSVANQTDFGGAMIGSGTVTRTFTIRNAGNLPLDLTETPMVAVSGPQAEDFTVTRQPSSPIPGGGSATFDVSFTPGAAWLRTATLSISSNDPDESAYAFAVQGTGTGTLAATYSTGDDVALTTSSFRGAGSTVNFALAHAPAAGTELMVVRNTGLEFVQSVFDNLSQGQKVSLPFAGITYQFVVNYYGGTGNDLVLVWANNRPLAWGGNANNQLGDNTVTNRPVAVPVTATGALSGKTVVAVAAGESHSLALCSDGTVAAWGYNNRGQLGDGTTTSRTVPVAVTSAAGVSALAGKTVVAVAAGISHSLALCSDGTVAAWGLNAYGQLGDNSSTNRSVPVAVNVASGVSALAGKSVVAVAAGAYHSLALCADGTMCAWGYNSNGQLGDGTTTARMVPVAVDTAAGRSALVGKTVVAVAAGSFHSLALCSDGTVAAWGYNNYGQLGDSTTTTRLMPVAVNTDSETSALAGKAVVAVATGSSHSLALCTDGAVAAWGYNSGGQLGDNTTTNRPVPILVDTTPGLSALAGKTVAMVAAGSSHSLALCQDGTAVAWGANALGQLGDNSTAARLVAERVSRLPLAFGERFTKIRSGPPAGHSLGLAALPYTSDIHLTGNGVAIPAGNTTPSLANHTDFGTTAAGGGTVTRTFTIQNTGTLPLNLTGMPRVSVSGVHAADFTVTRQPDSPIPAGGSATFDVSFTPGAAWLRTATLGISSDDPDESSFGFEIQGNRSGTLAATFSTGGDVPLTTRAFRGAGSSVNLTLAFAPATGTELMVVRNTGLEFAQGAFGNLAQGQKVSLPFGGITYEFVASYYGGTGNDLVLRWANNRTLAWGDNADGQLGNGSTAQSNVPVPVTATGALAGKTVVAVAAGAFHCLALCSDGIVAAWGDNYRGQLGDNTSTTRSAPVLVNTASGVSALAGKTVVAVAAGASNSLALCSDGTVAAWGDNASGQLGDNSSNTLSAVPVAVNAAAGVSALAGKSVVAVAAGAFSLALCSDGTVAAWGANSYGQLGDGTPTKRAVPVAVDTTLGRSALAGKTVMAVATGSFHSLALCSDGTVAAWGYNYYNQLGDNTATNRFFPVAVNTDSGVSALSGKSVTAVAAGGSHNLALCTDGTVAAWGNNPNGQLGDNTTINSPVPVVVNTTPGLSALAGKTVANVAAGGSHSLAFCQDGTAVAWGGNATGQLGNNSTARRVVAGEISNLPLGPGERFTLIRSGPSAGHTLALAAIPYLPDIHLTGNGAAIPAGSTTPSQANHTDFGAIAAGGGTVTRTFTVRNMGTLPLNLTGTPKVTVDGTHAADFTVTRQPNSPIAAGGSATFDVSFTPGAAWLRTATLGITSDDPDESPYGFSVQGTRAGTLAAIFSTGGDVPLTLSRFTAKGSTVNLALNHAPATGTELMVVRNTGSEFITGIFGNLAQGQKVSLSYGGIAYEFVANYYGGSGNDLVLLWANTMAFAWGKNSSSQLGDNSTTSRTAPVPVVSTGVLAGKTVLAVAAGGGHSLALCSDGTVAAWGANASGQLGDGTTTNRSVPVAVSKAAGVSALAGKTVVAVAAGTNHSLALCSDGTVAAWGGNWNGELGDATTTSHSVPWPVNTAAGVSALAGKAVVAVATRGSHSLALCSDNTVVAWGDNHYGQLGNATASSGGNVPVAVNTASGVSALAGKTVVAVAAGTNHSLALCADGTVAAWGNNSYGQLGDNTATSCFAPVAVTTTFGDSALSGRTVVAVAAGNSHSLALCSDGTVAAWGANFRGQLGDGTVTNRFAPVAVNATPGVSALAGKVVVSVSAALSHSLAFLADGTVAAWGDNSSGQLGDTTTTDRSVPTAINATRFVAGERFTTLQRGASAAHNLALVALVSDLAISCGTDSILNGGSRDFGRVAVGSLANQVFTISNPGTANLTGLAVSVSGPDSAAFTVGPISTAPVVAGGSTTFTVRFNPTSEGIKTAVLRVASNDPDENPFSISLTGNLDAALRAWRLAHFGSPANTGVGADLSDPDNDGISNLLEFSFGLNPLASGVQPLPGPQRVADEMVISFTQPESVAGVTYGAEWSATMQPGSWATVPDTGNTGASPPQHVFSVPIGSDGKCFMRLQVTNRSLPE